MKIKDGAFTLIELLVVISIIGALASIILVALSDARDRGRIGADMVFSGTNYHALGDTATAVYHLDGTNDDSSHNNNLVLSGNITFVPGVIGNAASFDGVSYAYAPNSTNIGSGSWTMSAWIKPAPWPQYGWQVFLNYNLPYLAISNYANDVFGSWWDPAAGQYYVPGGPWGWNRGPTIQPNKWYLVTMTHNDVARTTILYFDGQPYSTVTNTGSGPDCGVQLYIGAMNGACSGQNPFNYNGLIDDVYIFPQALSAAQVAHVYAMGLPRHAQDIARAEKPAILLK